MLIFCAVCLAFATFLLLYLNGLWKKILAANLATTLVVVAIVLVSLKTGVSYYLDVALAFSLLSFIGTQFFARFLSGRGGM